MKYPVPEPVVVSMVCSLCGEPWQLHAEPSVLECIRLLKLRRGWAVPYIQYPQVGPYWITSKGSSTGGTYAGSGSTQTVINS